MKVSNQISPHKPTLQGANPLEIALWLTVGRTVGSLGALLWDALWARLAFHWETRCVSHWRMHCELHCLMACYTYDYSVADGLESRSYDRGSSSSQFFGTQGRWLSCSITSKGKTAYHGAGEFGVWLNYVGSQEA